MTSELASRLDICLFMGHPKRTKGYVFYSPFDNNMYVNTNARFLEDNFIKNMKPRNRLVFEELSRKESSTPQKENVSQSIIREMQIKLSR